MSALTVVSIVPLDTYGSRVLAASGDLAAGTQLDDQQFGAAMIALALIVLLLAIQTINQWRR
jgi:hypothetical protein